MFVGVRVPLSVQVGIGSISFCTAGKKTILGKSVFFESIGFWPFFVWQGPQGPVWQFPQEPCQTVAGPCRTVFCFVVSDTTKSGALSVRQKSPGAFCLRITCLRAVTGKFLRPFFGKPKQYPSGRPKGRRPEMASRFPRTNTRGGSTLSL